MRLGSVLLAVVVVSSACGKLPDSSCSVVLGNGTGGFGGTNPDEAPLAALVGEPTTVRLTDPALLVCDGLARAPSAARTTVEDGPGAAVPHTATAPVATLNQGSSVSVTFTPTRAGQHLLTASFEPALGVARRTLTAIEERSWNDAATYPTDTPCTRAYAAHGGLLCSHASGWRFWTADGGQPLGDAGCQARPSATGVWLACGGGLSFLEPDAGALVVTATGAPTGTVRGLVALGQRAVVASDTMLTELVVDGGAVLAQRTVMYGRAFADWLGVVPVSDLGFLLVAPLPTTTASFVPWTGAAGSRTVVLEAAPAWADDGALWLADAAGKSLQRLHYDFSVDLPTRSFAPALSAPLNVGAANRPQGLPQGVFNGKVLVLDAKRLVWVAVSGAVTGSNGSIAWRTNADGGTRVLTLSP